MPLHVHHRVSLLSRVHRGFTAGGLAVASSVAAWPDAPTTPPPSRSGSAAGQIADATLQRPTARTHRAGFRRILHSAAALPGDAGAVEAWYSLRRIVIASEADQFLLTGIKADLRSPRTADAGNALTWATAGGFDAYVVIGRNLRFLTPGQWTRQRSKLLFATSTLILPPTAGPDDEIITTLTFPPGNMGDTNPTKETSVREFGWEGFPFKVGDSLDVALVVLASRVSSGNAANYVDGFADIEIKVCDLYRSSSLAS
jgi:hypothetical protein